MITRPASAIDARADKFVADFAALDPIAATGMGIAGFDDKMPDLSPEGEAARADIQREFLADLEGLTPQDDVDRVTFEAAKERHGLYIELIEAGVYRSDANNIASPAQALRDVFDLMPTATTEDWETITERMEALPAAMDGYIASLREGVAKGPMPALRQVKLVIDEAAELADKDTSFFTEYVAGAQPDGRAPAAPLAKALEQAAAGARQAYADLADTLAREVADEAPEEDAVGRDLYSLLSRVSLGATVDLDETYEWGLVQLADIDRQQHAVAEELYGSGVSPREAMDRLNADPTRKLHGTAALRDWMQATADAAMAFLDGTHFDIPEPVKTIECMIAPTQTGGIYYTGPSEDFTRPGRMWWSVPAGVEEFSTWYEKTTVYHEGVPGHHLQIAQTTYRAELLNKWRRLFSWVSGHGEGWALYAEKLMEEFGFLSEAGDRMGMLDSQRLRATRVALDIGVHLGKPFPGGYGHDGERWNYENAWTFLRSNVTGTDPWVRFELNRYFGWPGQAPSYMVGQRLWEEIRDESRKASEARGEQFSLKDFHRTALDVGSVGLDTLRTTLLG